MTRAAILVAALLTAHPDPVLAGSTCGSSGGGSSGGGSTSGDSSSSSSDSSSSSSSESTPACHDTTDVVGHRECTRFGAWAKNLDLPIVHLEVGTAMRATPSLIGSRGGTITHGTESFAYRTVEAPEADLDHQVVTSARAGVGGVSGVFVAVDVEGGSVVAPARAGTEMMSSGVFGRPTVTQGRGVVFNVAGVVGIKRAVGPGRLGVEVAGGVRTVQYTLESSYFNCETTTTIASAAPLLEARAGYQHWLSPLVSVGATLGASVIDRGSWVGGLNVGFHTRAFGGSR